MKLEYWDYRYTNQRMRNDWRRLKALRQFYHIYKNAESEWSLSIPIMDYGNPFMKTPPMVGMLITGLMKHELWCDLYNPPYVRDAMQAPAWHHYDLVGAELIKHEDTLVGMIKIAREARQFWANVPIKIWGQQQNGEWGYINVPNNATDLVAFVLTHG